MPRTCHFCLRHCFDIFWGRAVRGAEEDKQETGTDCLLEEAGNLSGEAGIDIYPGSNAVYQAAKDWLQGLSYLISYPKRKVVDVETAPYRIFVRLW